MRRQNDRPMDVPGDVDDYIFAEIDYRVSER